MVEGKYKVRSNTLLSVPSLPRSSKLTLDALSFRQPVRVTASATKGIGASLGCAPQTEDTITLLVDWVNVKEPEKKGTGVYTAS